LPAVEQLRKNVLGDNVGRCEEQAIASRDIDK
jgi:hypothetical protein